MQSQEEYKAEKAATIQNNLTIVDQAGIYGNDYALVLPGNGILTSRRQPIRAAPWRNFKCFLK